MVQRALISASVIFYMCVPYSTNAQQENPYEADPAAIRAGATLYAGRCADCHGADAKGTRGPDLTQLWASGASDQRVFASIRTGVTDSIMPPSFAPDIEIWAIVAYLRSISTVPPFPSDGADVEHGLELFASLCTDCHRVIDRGGALGPELTRIAQIRSREALTKAIRDPSAAVARGYRAVTLVTKSGERIRGVAKSEDAFSIQVMDDGERLQGYLKADLDELNREQDSPMPRFRRARLTETELDDLLAFLASLREVDSAGRGRGSE